MAAFPDSKKRKLEEEDSEINNEDGMNVVLALCGSFNPITFLHLRTFGNSFNEKIEIV